MSNYVHIAMEYDLFNEYNINYLAEQIENGGKTLIIADGGDKAKEFNIYADHLKVGDHLMVHDWGTEVWIEQIKQKIYDNNIIICAPWASYATELRTLFMPFLKEK